MQLKICGYEEIGDGSTRKANIARVADTIKGWGCVMTAGLLKGVFFEKYSQAYFALRKWESQGLVKRVGNGFEFTGGE
jgi:hypothetical protein